MKEFVASITQRSQVTIPARVRRAQGLKARDKVAFTIEHDGVRLKPARFTLESAYGSVKPYSLFSSGGGGDIISERIDRWA